MLGNLAQEAPIWLFLFHVSYISFQIRTVMHMDKCIILITHPSTFSLPMDSKFQEEDVMWNINSTLHASPCSISISIFSCIYLISYIFKYVSRCNVWTSFISSLIKIPNVSIQPRELVGLMELSCYAIIKKGDITDCMTYIFMHYECLKDYEMFLTMKLYFTCRNDHIQSTTR